MALGGYFEIPMKQANITTSSLPVFQATYLALLSIDWSCQIRLLFKHEGLRQRNEEFGHADVPFNHLAPYSPDKQKNIRFRLINGLRLF